ncbi:SDR family NAD(P)-dependent oxidoreductase [Tomitella biformata]|uniref:SDR family NAD(P)-dependent oxidoreductase n=1 Tax=Tomitella biformata TaxID=630403 RepID=UPI00046474C0|nr:SDR family NAD(P)-dependent oxidoreductase [Tomitella biformata]
MSTAHEIFAGGTAVITGAASGIGEGLARHAAALGMNVVLADIDSSRVEAVAEELSSGGTRTLAMCTDVSDPHSVEVLAASAYEQFGSIRLLVNNAGVEAPGLFWEVPVERWHQLLSINVGGVVNCVHSFLPRMINAGEQAYVLNVSSIGGLSAGPLQSPYLTSKHAVLALSETLYLDVQAAGAPVQVSAVLPGAVRTRIYSSATGNGASGEGLRDQLDQYLSNGITPAQAAETILAQAADGAFWIGTQPEELTAFATYRAEHLAHLTPPAPFAPA